MPTSKEITKNDLELVREELQTTTEFFEEKWDSIQKDVKVIRTIVEGNGDPSKSLVVRFDRMEQMHARRQWIVRTALISSIASLAGLISVLIKIHFFP